MHAERGDVEMKTKLFLALSFLFFSLASALHGQTWNQVNSDGFGDANNTDSVKMAVFNNRLYVGAENYSTGVEVWQYEGTNWIQVNTDGFGDANNAGTRGMVAFNNRLYVGTFNPTTGGELWAMDELAPAPTASVPAMTEWGIIILTVLLGAGSVYYLRRLKLGV